MRALLALLLLGSAALAHAAVLGVGDPLPKLRLTTQHEQAASPALNARQWLFAADNDAANLAGALLDGQAASWLADTQRVYLADIHKMPALIARMVALPRLRDKPYPILLGRDADTLAMLPRQRGCVSVLDIQQQKISAVHFACDQGGLAALVR
ncbi:hypothetical protein [Rivihabitans pingtungensis]|uniref:FAD/FMN-containing dehydrogenase n=1 Tax=Rivihabitans pingtungensis TaxID=1054498 RepID=A0A318KJW3_9NEIS|nr:hypothetical protein [Rivihabitans pingtungensis]PXX75091.1 hypothetical protein DFR34_12831 [Rivihabitans pingtungensis]